MIRFWKRKNVEASADAASPWPALLAAIYQSESDLMRVAGPEDGGSVCTDWVGAIVSVSGLDKRFPALVDAIEDGLFHTGCRHRLEAYRTEADETHAAFCTKIAIAGMTRRSDERGALPPISAGPDADASRERFTRWYDLARSAERAERAELALHDCHEALTELTRNNIFGDDQLMIERVLKGRMQTMLRAQQRTAAKDSPVA